MVEGRILLIEDSKPNQALLKRILAPEGHRIEAVGDGASGLEMAATKTFDLILLDVVMPGMDGFEVCRKLKLHPKTRSIPVIFLTAKSEMADLVQGFELGAADYVTKPYQAPELLTRVANQLKLAQAHSQMLDQNRELNLAVSTRDKFFSLIAHDLKAPLQILQGMVEHLRDPEVLEDREDLEHTLSLLSDYSGKTSRLLDDLLDWAKTQLSGLNAVPERLELLRLVESIADLTGRMAEPKNIALEIDIDPGLAVFADERTLATVLRNLINNAIKFSPPNTRTRIYTSIDGPRVWVGVQDQGVGISEENQAKLFLLGEQFSTDGTAGEGGTGLGLLLCKEFAELNKGELGFSSTEGEGSLFWFTVPLAHPA